MSQKIIFEKDAYKKIQSILKEKNIKKYMLVCGSSFKKSFVMDYLKGLDIPFTVFSDFTANPDYNEVCKGVECFHNENCDAVIAAGGGSAIDVAKCIKLFSSLDNRTSYLKQEYSSNSVPLIAIPTTAGTGSESTKFSVIYYKGEKQSVHHDSIVPQVAVLEPELLKSLPDFQKKCTLMDALCQAIESWWSVHSTEESQKYAEEAVKLISKYGDEYIFEPTQETYDNIMLASNLAGRAINMTATTAPHAMSYKLTTLYGLPHGYSVALSLPRVWEYMMNHPEYCSDKRGADYLFGVFEKIANAFGAGNTESAIKKFYDMLKKYGLTDPCSENYREDIEKLVKAVNVSRLGNNPVTLSETALYGLYERIVKNEA